MARSIDPTSREAIGTIKTWIRPNASTALPANWVLCDGSVLMDSDSPFDGSNLPDMRNRYMRGGNISNLSFPTDMNYVLGGSGVVSGGATNHSHGVFNAGAHSHGVNGSTANAGDHSHGSGSLLASGTTGTIPTCNTAGSCPIDFGLTLGFHTHNVTANLSGNTANAGTHAHNMSFNTSNTGSHAHNMNAEANDPQYHGYAYIIKVK